MLYSHLFRLNQDKSIYLSLPILAMFSFPVIAMPGGEMSMENRGAAYCEANPDTEKCQQIQARMADCADNPDAAECQRPPKGQPKEQMAAYCEENADDEKCQQFQERMATCEATPDAAECQRPSKGPSKEEIATYCEENANDEKCQQIQARIAACEATPDAAECQRPPKGQPKEEMAAYCEENADDEKCQQFQEREEMAAYCEENADDEKCQQFQERMAVCGQPAQHGHKRPLFKQVNRCKHSPEKCQKPGPGSLNLQKGRLHLPAIQVPLGNGEIAYYEANLQMTEDGNGFTIEEITDLQGDSEEVVELPQ